MTQCNSRSCMLPTIPCCHNLYRTAETIAVLQLLYSATAGIGPQRQKIHCFQRQKKPYLFDFHIFAISSKKTNSKWLDRIFEPQVTLVGTRISHVFFVGPERPGYQCSNQEAKIPSKPMTWRSLWNSVKIPDSELHPWITGRSDQIIHRVYQRVWKSKTLNTEISRWGNYM